MWCSWVTCGPQNWCMLVWISIYVCMLWYSLANKITSLFLQVMMVLYWILWGAYDGVVWYMELRHDDMRLVGAWWCLSLLMMQMEAWNGDAIFFCILFLHFSNIFSYYIVDISFVFSWKKPIGGNSHAFYSIYQQCIHSCYNRCKLFHWKS